LQNDLVTLNDKLDEANQNYSNLEIANELEKDKNESLQNDLKLHEERIDELQDEIKGYTNDIQY